MLEAESVSRFRLKRILDELASKEGRGTELISLYIPPGRRIHEVLANLREEYGTASNIKSRTTRKNVQEAIEKVIQRLKLYRAPPKNGLVIFCGAIPQNGPGSERMELYEVEPVEPINIYFYRCDSRFHVEPLLDQLKEKETYGILVIDASEAALATLKGRKLTVLDEYHSGVGGKHKTGGQSARRFERIREMEINSYFRRVGNHVNEKLLGIEDLKGLILGGPGPTKYEFAEGDYLNYMLKKKILAIVDTSYVGESGVEEVVSRSSEILKGVRYSEEKALVQRFLYELGHDTGLAAYGERDVRAHLESDMVDVLLISEKLSQIHVWVRCKACGYGEDHVMEKHKLPKFQQDLTAANCPECSNNALVVEGVKDLLDEFIDMAEKSGAKVEVISTETDEGVMLLHSFGGIAAILKFKASH
ncbi:MAG: peptide chain release factor aRF-1 [Candidatus Bathyarchaeia archaeon]|nr:peptide chain release factor aRF-1 [Candidatus Bathyarchaeota archaeon]